MTQGRPTLAILQVPMRRGSLSGGRFDLAPKLIERMAFEYVFREPGDVPRVAQLGVHLGSRDEVEEANSMRPEEAFEPIRRAVAAFASETDQIQGMKAVAVLGGDNSITRPGTHGLAFGGIRGVGLLTLDAHHDARQTSIELTNGNPVRALIEDGLPGANVIQVGIQPFANMPDQAKFVREAGIGVITADEVRERGIEPVVTEALDALAARADAIYVDLDVDVLDRAFAPACPGARPGGLTPAELQAAARLSGAHPKVRVMDLVEVDPERDVGNITVLAAASFLMAFAAGLAARGTG